MPIKTFSHQCSERELAGVEAQWRAQGFRLVQKNSEKELLPFEYLKTSHRGSATSFEGPVTWTLCRREE